MGLMAMISMMTKSCSPAMIVVTILFEKQIPVAHSVVLNSSMMKMRMSLRNPHLVVEVHQVVGRVALLQRALAVVQVALPVVHLVVQVVVLPVEVLAAEALPVEALAAAPQAEAPVAALPVEVLAVALPVEVLAVVHQVEVLAVAHQAVVKVAPPSERVLLGD